MKNLKTFLSGLFLCLPFSVFGQESVLNFEDRQDFEDATRGFIATCSEPVLRNEDGSIAYDLSVWDFLDKDCPETADKGLWRQSQLNRIHGLFEVIPGRIYQIRGFDIANMTFVKSDNGWIIIDVTTSKASAVAGYELLKKEIGNFPVEAVIITHPHADHFGGIDAIIENAPNDDFEVIVPKGFLKAAQDENVIAGVAMGRRASYMFGFQLPKEETGNIGCGLGQITALGQKGMPVPTREISETGEKLSIDGIDMEFVYAESAEAPVELMIYFPQFKAFCVAEEINRTMHNLVTLRGAVVRNGLLWSKHIDTALERYGNDVEVSFSTHHWPTWGNGNIVKYWTAQRDLYRYIHDQTLNLANKGYTPNEIAEMVSLPESMDTLFYCRSFYGSVSHNVKSQYQLYFGWFDGNPANLNPLPPAELGAKYVEAMGGSKKVIKQARKAYRNKEYRWCASLLNNLVFSEPDNVEARRLLADTYRQLGYGTECAPWRNFYLTGAQELMGNGRKMALQSIDWRTVAGLEYGSMFDFIAIQINGKLASGKSARINVHFTDRNYDAVMMLSNGALSHRLDTADSDADLTVNISKSDFAKLMFGVESPDRLISTGQMTCTGSLDALSRIISSMDRPDPGFNIVVP